MQELIPGSQEKIYSLFTYIGRDGDALANVVGRKLRQGPLRFGTSAVFLVDYDERVLELGLRLLLSRRATAASRRSSSRTTRATTRSACSR